MSQRFNDCIYCGKRAGSAEHVVAASLGGLRKDRGILCAACNGGFSGVDESLADDLRLLNAQVGVQHGRNKEPVRAIVQDPETGQRYYLSEGGKLQHPDPVVLRDQTVDGIRFIEAVASTQKQADDLVHGLKAEGKPVKTVRSSVPHLLVRQPQQVAGFGGTPSFRALVKTVLNLLAQWRPDVARQAGFAAIKQFAKDGGENTFANFDYPDSTFGLPEDSFEFQHRFVIALDAENRAAYARISLLGVHEVSVRLAVGEWEASATYVYDMDVLAQHEPHDIKTHRFPGQALAPPGAKTADPRGPYSQRLARLLRKCSDRNWRGEAPALLTQLNDVRSAPEWDRHGLIVAALEGQRGRLLQRAVDFVDQLGRHLEGSLGATGRALADSFKVFVSGDQSSKSGVTTMSFTVVEMLRMVMADHLLEVLNQRELTDDELRGLLERVAGTRVVGGYLFDEMKKQHPLLRTL